MLTMPFGLLVDHGPRTFGFPLTSEQTISTVDLIANALFILSAPICLYRLRHAPRTFLVPNWFGFIKILNASLLASLHLPLLILWTLSPYRTSVSVASAAVSCVASTALVYPSWVLHFRLARPASLTCLYLLVWIICDAFQVWTLRLLTHWGPIASVALATLIVKALLFILECHGKRSLLREQYRRELGAEETASIFSRWFLAWLNPLFITGYKKILVNDDLPKPDTELSSEYLRIRIQKTFDERCK